MVRRKAAEQTLCVATLPGDSGGIEEEGEEEEEEEEELGGGGGGGLYSK